MIENKIYFKLIYSIGITINIPNIKISQLNSYIKNIINQKYNLTEYNIINAKYGEYGPPIDETENVYFYSKYTVLNSFYIRPLNYNITQIFCNICMDYTTNNRILRCSHFFCIVCIEQWLTQSHNNTCPLCRTII